MSHSARRRWAQTILAGILPCVVGAAVMSPGLARQAALQPYSILSGGVVVDTLGTVDGKDIIAINGATTYPTTGQLNLTTVQVETGVPVPYALSRWLGGDTLSPKELYYPRNVTMEQVQKFNASQFSTSQSSAVTAAMGYLNIPMELAIGEVGAVSAATSANGGVSSDAESSPLRAGDGIVSINGQTADSPEAMLALVQSQPVGSTVDLELRRRLPSTSGTPELTMVNVSTTTVALPTNTSVSTLDASLTTQPATNLQISFAAQDIGGPSAGLMMTLGIIDKLTPEDLAGGRTIAGTGQISADGTVKPIAGIIHKIEASKAMGATVFLAPSANCAEALHSHHDGVQIAKVDSVTDAMNALSTLRDGGTPTLCE